MEPRRILAAPYLGCALERQQSEIRISTVRTVAERFDGLFEDHYGVEAPQRCAPIICGNTRTHVRPLARMVRSLHFPRPDQRGRNKLRVSNDSPSLPLIARPIGDRVQEPHRRCDSVIG
jgi:hypothetical protein